MPQRIRCQTNGIMIIIKLYSVFFSCHWFGLCHVIDLDNTVGIKCLKRKSYHWFIVLLQGGYIVNCFNWLLSAERRAVLFQVHMNAHFSSRTWSLSLVIGFKRLTQNIYSFIILTCKEVCEGLSKIWVMFWTFFTTSLLSLVTKLRVISFPTTFSDIISFRIAWKCIVLELMLLRTNA